MPIEIEWLPNTPGTLRDKGRTPVLVLGYDLRTSKRHPDGRWLVSVQPEGSMLYVDFSEVCMDPKFLKAAGESEAEVPNGPPCLMCGQPTHAGADDAGSD